jgi:hypothetical protein
MKQFQRHTVFSLIAAVLTALALCVPASASAPAGASDLGLQNASLSCSDGTLLQVALSTPELTALANAVTAINLFPAGDPALTCSLTQSTGLRFATAGSFSDSASANGPKDFAVGGGKLLTTTCGLVNFSLSAHVANNAPAAPGQQGVGGTYNNSTGATSPCGQGHFTSKVDCVQVTGNVAEFTAQITHATGSPFFGSPGDEIAVAVKDNNPDELTIEGGFFASGPCDFSFAAAFTTPIAQGNISVHDAP